MNKFLFKSTDADLQKIYQSIETIQKNVLYLTHQVDFIRRIIVETKHDNDLRNQVDNYYSPDETSHQTELEDK